MTTTPFRAEVSQGILKKADRLFSNRLSSIFIELIQNSRRAGASLITVNATREADETTLITFEDDGSGVEDFSKLLHLGQSAWDADTARTEDAAGMGFFSLIHTGVLVQSLGMSAFISPEAFMGLESVTAEPSTFTPSKGTRLNFRRSEQIMAVVSVLTDVAQFGSVDVVINGALIARRDFLKDSLYVRTVDGVRIGVFNGAGHRTPCNFHGSVIEFHHSATSMSDVTIPPVTHSSQPLGLHVKLDMTEATKLHLKLPDRTQVVEDEAFIEMMREVRIAMYGYLATLPTHCASYENYREAHSLGIDLAEAAPFMRGFCVAARDRDHDDTFFSERGERGARIVDTSHVALVDTPNEVDDVASFTFEVGFTRFDRSLPLLPLEMAPRYEGYSWYDALPRYQNFVLLIDGKPAVTDEDGITVPSTGLLTVVSSIELQFELKRPAGEVEPFSWESAFAGFGDEDGYSDTTYCLFITKDSTWAKQSDPHAQPFSLVMAAQYLGFWYRDDDDSYNTQVDYFTDCATSELTRVLGGEMAMARMELEKVTSYSDLVTALNAANICGVNLSKGDKGWSFEITEAA
jgi:hypothetical protein